MRALGAPRGGGCGEGGKSRELGTGSEIKAEQVHSKHGPTLEE